MQHATARPFPQSLLLDVAERLTGIHPDDPLNGFPADRPRRDKPYDIVPYPCPHMHVCILLILAGSPSGPVLIHHHLHITSRCQPLPMKSTSTLRSDPRILCNLEQLSAHIRTQYV